MKRIPATPSLGWTLFNYRIAPLGLVLAFATAPSGCGSHESGADPVQAESETAPVGQTTQRLSSGPIHAWALDEASGTTALDSSTTGAVNGTLGSLATRIAGGRVGAGAVRLPGGGNTSVIDFGGTVGVFGTSDFTATYWVRRTQTNNAELLGNRACGSACNFWGMRASATGVNLEMYENSNSLNGAGVGVAVNVSDGMWHFIGARRSGTTVSLFVDGQKSSAMSAGVTNLTSTTPLTFGSNPIAQAFGTTYVGDVDEVRLYNRALADCELTGSPALCAPSDVCHTAGTCDIATGVCTDPQVACAAQDECHNIGTCATQSGVCTNPVRADGAVCSKGTCQAGVCTAAPTPSVIDPRPAAGGCGCWVAADPSRSSSAGAFAGLAFALTLMLFRRRISQTICVR